MPASLTPEDIISSSDTFGLSIGDILAVQAGLIKARADESGRARQAAMKINYINKVVRDLKYRLRSISLTGSRQGRVLAVPLIERIARYEAAKARRIREMESPDRKLFAVFAPLFDNVVRAKRSLNGSKRKLKMMILYKMNARGPGRGLSVSFGCGYFPENEMLRYLELNSGRSSIIEEHLRSCPVCMKEIIELNRINARLEVFKPGTAPSVALIFCHDKGRICRRRMVGTYGCKSCSLSFIQGPVVSGGGLHGGFSGGRQRSG